MEAPCHKMIVGLLDVGFKQNKQEHVSKSAYVNIIWTIILIFFL